MKVTERRTFTIHSVFLSVFCKLIPRTHLHLLMTMIIEHGAQFLSEPLQKQIVVFSFKSYSSFLFLNNFLWKYSTFTPIISIHVLSNGYLAYHLGKMNKQQERKITSENKWNVSFFCLFSNFKDFSAYLHLQSKWISIRMLYCSRKQTLVYFPTSFLVATTYFQMKWIAEEYW